MLIVSITGGLGNQLFQYCLALHLKQLGRDVYIDKLSYRRDGYKRAYSLDILPSRIPIMPNGKVKKLTSGKPLHRLARVLSGGKRIDTFKETSGDSWRQVINLNDADDCRVVGYWQTAEMVAATSLMLQDLQALRSTLQMPAEMQAANVAIHVRQGWNNDAHGNKITDHVKKGGDTIWLASDYYARAIEEVKKEIENPVFAIFGDDEEWCRRNILPMANAGSVVVAAGDRADWQDMLLMSLFKAIICANSSFSWWGGMLCDGTVIAPDKWSKDKDKSAVIYPPHWIRI